MKSYLTGILFFCCALTYGQSLVVSSGLEQTVAGTELHLSTGYATKNNWALGAFHQTKISMVDVETTSTKPAAQWYGVFINAPIANTKKINVLIQVRTGLTEDRFIVVVPSVETQINFSKALSISFGGSVRYSYPGLSFKTNIRPFNIGKK